MMCKSRIAKFQKTVASVWRVQAYNVKHEACDVCDAFFFFLPNQFSSLSRHKKVIFINYLSITKTTAANAFFSCFGIASPHLTHSATVRIITIIIEF